LAAEQGDASSQAFLASMYFMGKGVLQDYTKAHKWSNLAAAGGSDVGVDFRREFSQKMTHQKINTAQQMAIECQARNYKKCD
jgi:TPR repeat protein